MWTIQGALKSKETKNTVRELTFFHCVKSVSIRSFSGPHSVRMWENTDQKNSEYGHFSRSVYFNNMSSQSTNQLICSGLTSLI